MKDEGNIVVDCCVTSLWFTKDASNKALLSYSESVLDLLTQGYRAIVPKLWEYEVSNVMSTLIKHKLTSMSAVLAFLEAVKILNIEVIDTGMFSAISSRTALAIDHNLSAYDAAYLQLAISQDAPLATIDKKLKVAAKKQGCFFES